MKARLAALLLVPLALAGCERAAQDMYDQPRGKAYRATTLFPDGAMTRPPPPGARPYSRGAAAEAASGRAGADEVARQARADAATAMPEPVTPQLLLRGRQRYDIYCLPCHSPVGDGDGRVARRGFPAPPSYHQARLRETPDRHIYDVISRGFGAMHGYAERIEPTDRWAIVAFVRALQLSQHAEVAALPPDVRRQALAGLRGADGGAARASLPGAGVDRHAPSPPAEHPAAPAAGDGEPVHAP